MGFNENSFHWDLENISIFQNKIDNLLNSPFDFLYNDLLNLYFSTELYKRNTALNLPHEFTTNKEIYHKTGIYGIGIKDSKTYCYGVCYNHLVLYGNTDMLHILYKYIKNNNLITYVIYDMGSKSPNDLIFPLSLSLRNPYIHISECFLL